MNAHDLAAAWDQWQNDWIEAGSGDDFIVLDGVVIYHQLRVSVADVERMRIRIVAAAENPSQALALNMSPGSLLFQGELVKQGNFFADEGPKEAVVELKPKKGQEFCWVWNLWERDGRLDSLIGAHGLIVTEFDVYIQLNCTDPIGEVDFEDLIAHVMIEDQSGNWCRPTLFSKPR